MEFDDSIELPFENFKVLRTELKDSGASQSVTTSLFRIALDGLKASFLKREIIRDLLADVTTLTQKNFSSFSGAIGLVKRNEKESSRLTDLFHSNPITSDAVRRDKLRLRNSSELILQTKCICRHAPIENNSIQINLSEDGNSFLVLKLRNRFSMWMWTKWICFLYDIWTGTISFNDIPDWASAGEYKGYAVMYTNNNKGSGNLELASVRIDRPFELRFCDINLSISNIFSIVISLDSILPKSYALIVDILQCNMNGGNNANNSVEFLTANSFSGSPDVDKSKSNLFSSVFGVAAGVAVNTVHAARAVARGTVMQTAQDTLLGVKNDITTIVANAPKNVLNQYNVYAIAQFNGINHSTDHFISTGDWNQTIYIDLDENEDENQYKHDFGMTNRLDVTKLGLNLFIYSGIEGVEQLVAQKHFSYRKLLLLKESRDKPSTNEGDEMLKSCVNEVKELQATMNSNLGDNNIAI